MLKVVTISMIMMVATIVMVVRTHYAEDRDDSNDHVKLVMTVRTRVATVAVADTFEAGPAAVAMAQRSARERPNRTQAPLVHRR